MNHLLFRVMFLTLLLASLVLNAKAQNLTQAGFASDHITSEGPDSSIQDQIEYLIRNWPSDFEIVVVEAITGPKCNQAANQSCSVQVKPIDVILGHSQQPSYRVSYGPAKHCTGDNAKCVYTYDEVRFEVRRGDRMVAMLTPMMQPRHAPMVYIATRLDRANEALIESVRNTVAESLMAGTRREAKP